MPYRLPVILLVILSLVAACGWQLRGTVALSSLTDTLHITGQDTYGPLLTELRNRLQADDITLTDTPSEARYTLDIVQEQTEKRVAALGSDALAGAYELTLTAQFNVLDSRGIPIASRLTSQITRSYNASAASAGSSSQEEMLLLSEMREELAQQILRQLQAAINAAQARGMGSEPEPQQPPAPGTDSSPAKEEASHGEAAP
ncbi:LPS assembly lipoprotein LptE [Marinimicrobium agarilyticum]|uniref:LPS-assembly lipoprotein LptE n=1 Tax=Marinimicrobium agarilyticum TaxID=306546 RepID=UPI00042A27B6|nr:LPS assembly lipoprotein LptE [Marinimicrobium agarilyticum]